MNTLLSLTSAQLTKAASIKDKIEALNKQLASLVGTSAAILKSAAKPAKKGMSAAGRARVAAAQKKRWAKIKASKSAAKVAVKPVAKKRSKMSAAGRARISAAAKARWAKVKAAGKTSL